jgi:hypothetical protein
MTQIQRTNSTNITRRFFPAECFSCLRRLDFRPLAVDCQLLLVLIATLSAGAAGAQGKKSKAPPPADLPGRVNYLARQLIGVPLDESDPLTSQIQTLVIDHLDAWMARRTPSVQEARREVESVFAALRSPLFADAESFSRPWKDETLVGIGYTLKWTDYNRVNVLALYDSRDGKSRRVALTNFVPHTDQRYEFLPSPESGDFRHLFRAYDARCRGKMCPASAALNTHCLQGTGTHSIPRSNVTHTYIMTIEVAELQQRLSVLDK